LENFWSDRREFVALEWDGQGIGGGGKDGGRQVSKLIGAVKYYKRQRKVLKGRSNK